MGSVVAWNSCEPDASRQGIEVLSSKSLWFLRLSGGVIDDLDGTMTIILPVLVISKKLLSARNGISVWSTSTTPSNGSRSGSTIDAAVFAPAAKPCCRRAQVAPSTAAPTCRWSGWPSGERPRTILSATTLSGASPSQPSPMSVDRRRHTHGISSALQQAGPRPPHSGQPKPSGQRRSNRTERNSLHPESAVEIRGARAASWHGVGL